MPVGNSLYHVVHKQAGKPHSLLYPQTVTLKRYHIPWLPTQAWHGTVVRQYPKFINTILGRDYFRNLFLVCNRISSVFSTVPFTELPIVIPPHCSFGSVCCSFFCQFGLVIKVEDFLKEILYAPIFRT